MAYIAPNSDVYILKGVSLDKNYNHTLYVTDLTTQYNTLVAYRKYTLNAQSYQRAGKGKIRVAILADNLYDCNYMMFRNTAYGNKWFYAFIDGVDYINDNATEINYTIDVMQTWYLDYELGQCFVEREHSPTDVAGENLVPENLEIGELITHDVVDVTDDYMLAAIVTSKKLPSEFTFTYDGESCKIFINTQYSEITTQSASGVPYGLYIAYGFAVGDDDITNHFLTNQVNYNMQECKRQAQTGLLPYRYTPPFLTLGSLIHWLDQGQGEFTGFSVADIVNVYIYPASMNLKTNMQRANYNLMRDGMTMRYENGVTRPTNFLDDPTADTDPYVPKNNKLYTYPYMQIMTSNNSGSTATYRYENFDEPDNPAFMDVGTFISNPVYDLVPMNHKGLYLDFDSGLVLTGFPTPPYKGSLYTAWLESNRYSMTASIVASVIGALPSIGTSVIAGNPMPAVRGGVSAFNSILGTLMKTEDLKNAPPQVQGQIMCDVLNTGANRTGFRIYNLTIKKQFARIIDDFFNMFGYAIKRVKIPNIRNANRPKRPHWNYVKTHGCVIHSASGKGLPSEDEDKISKIYDNGITFWNNLEEVGNYSYNNSPT